MRNVILLCLDTVRQDYFGRFASRLQKQADVEYSQCRAASGWSIPSHASMFTGKLPHSHGVHTHSRQYTQIDPGDTFLSEMPDHRSIGISTNAYASRNFGFDSLFDDFVEVSRDGFRFKNGLSPEDTTASGVMEYMSSALRDRYPIRSLLNGALSKYDPYDALFSGRPWTELKDNGTRMALSSAKSHLSTNESGSTPVFGFLNLMEAHFPMYHHRGLDSKIHSVPDSWTSKTGPSGGAYEISNNTDDFEQYLEYYRELYGASIEYLDRVVADWIGDIQELTSNETTFVITSDHGHNLGTREDSYLFGHHTSLSESVLHVPLLLVNPPEWYSSTQRIVSHLELGSLLVNLANEEDFHFQEGPVPAEVMGHTGSFPITSDLTYWDRLIRVVYEDQVKTTWDSLGSKRESTLDSRLQPSQRQSKTAMKQYPEYDTTLFDCDIRKAKRIAVEAGIASDEPDTNEEMRERLEDLGYL